MEFDLIRSMGVFVEEVESPLPKGGAYIRDLNLVVFRADLNRRQRQECADRLLVEMCRAPRKRSIPS